MKTLTRDEVYAIITRELPDETFARSQDPSKFYTTADDHSVAHVIGFAYDTSRRVYENYFPASADEFMGKWEKFVFDEVGDAASGLFFRRDRVLTKLRARKGIRKVDIEELVYLVIGSDKIIEIIEGNSAAGTWILDVSELGKSTILGGFAVNTAILSGPDLWEKTAAELGLTDDELAQYKKDAYGYTVKIINYMATDDELARIEALLTRYEPARSWHTIVNNATLEDAAFEWLLDFTPLGESTYL